MIKRYDEQLRSSMETVLERDARIDAVTKQKEALQREVASRRSSAPGSNASDSHRYKRSSRPDEDKGSIQDEQRKTSDRGAGSWGSRGDPWEGARVPPPNPPSSYSSSRVNPVGTSGDGTAWPSYRPSGAFYKTGNLRHDQGSLPLMARPKPPQPRHIEWQSTIERGETKKHERTSSIRADMSNSREDRKWL